MAKLVKELIISKIRKSNKNIKDIDPKVIAKYVREMYGCSPYLARIIAKELTQ